MSLIFRMQSNFSRRGRRLALFLLGLLVLCGCAEVTRPTPTDQELEAAQLTAAQRHPSQSWSRERVSRVFLRLLVCLPQIHGHTYPFLGFNWQVTATGKVAVDQVWYPSPAKDAGLERGDVILAVNNWPLPAWVQQYDRKVKTAQELFHDFFLVRRGTRSGRSYSSGAGAIMMPGEILAAIMLDVKHVALEAQGQYLRGPVQLLVKRDDKTFPLTLYPQHLPAEYAVMVNTQDKTINAYASPGKVILSQRLVSFCLNDDELAMIIGHELAHQAQGHLIRGAAHRELGMLTGEIITAFSTLSLTRILDWKHAMVAPDVRRVAQDAMVSVFSRGDELEADTYGEWYAFQAGYNVDKGLAVWERIAAVDEKDPFMTTFFLDSHPAPLERLTRGRRIAEYFKAGRAAEVFLQSASLNCPPTTR